MDLSPAGKMAAPGTVGAACQADADCTQANASCVLPNTNGFWIDGYCTVKNCPNLSCPDGSACQQGQTGLGAFTCLYKCTSDADCRSDYKCCDTSPASDSKVCAAKGVLCQ